MRIGFLTERMLLGYGVDLVTDMLAEGLSAKGHDVTVYCSFHDGTFQGGSYDLRAIQVPSSRSAREYEMRAEKAMRQLGGREDVWVVESFPFFKAASQFERPWIAIDYGVVPSAYFSRSLRRHFDYIRKTQYGTYLQNTSKIVCISQFLWRNLPPTLRGKAQVIYLGVDHYPPDCLVDLRKELDLDGVVILYQGRSNDTTPYKGVNTLLQIYSRLKNDIDDVTLLISTSCSLNEQRRLQREGAVVLNGVMMPFMPSVYQCSDIFATATQWEGFDLPLLEASYFGLPVVAFDIGAHPEIVMDQKTGYLVESQKEFLDRIKKLAEDPKLRRTMGKEGSAFSTKFKWTHVVDDFEQVIRGIAAQNQGNLF